MVDADFNLPSGLCYRELNVTWDNYQVDNFSKLHTCYSACNLALGFGGAYAELYEISYTKCYTGYVELLAVCAIYDILCICYKYRLECGYITLGYCYR